MPTTRRRHMITETPPVQRALDEVRDAAPSERINVAELVIRGARAKVAELRRLDRDAVEARRWLAEQIRAGALSADLDAAAAAKRHGLIE